MGETRKVSRLWAIADGEGHTKFAQQKQDSEEGAGEEARTFLSISGKKQLRKETVRSLAWATLLMFLTKTQMKRGARSHMMSKWTTSVPYGKRSEASLRLCGDKGCGGG